jgi:hypothetical protein
MTEKEILVLRAQDRLPFGTEVSLAYYPPPQVEHPLEDVLRAEGVTKQGVYCVVPPSAYYQNTLRFPFTERQKIESIIKFEVEDDLPLAGTEYLTDFIVLDEGEVLSFTASKETVGKLLAAFGSYRENVKGVIPLGAALLASARSVIDAPEFLLMDIGNDFTCVQHVRGAGVKHTLALRRKSDERYADSLCSGLLLLVKSAGGGPGDAPPLFLNTRSTAADDFRLANDEVIKELGVIPRAFPSLELVGAGPRHTARRGGDVDALSPPDLIGIAGGILVQGNAPSRKVNLLKEEFRPRSSGGVRIKDVMKLGAVLFLLLAVSLSNLFLELGMARRENGELKRAISALSVKVFGKPNVQPKEALADLEKMRKGIRRLESSIDRKSSGVELLRELSSFLPGDVVIEFTDIIIERDRIKFAGKARTFADIDRVKEALAASEYFSGVAVANTGTTGSTEGFTVSFLIDITVRTPGGG